jgi:hypothetical protein
MRRQYGGPRERPAQRLLATQLPAFCNGAFQADLKLDFHAMANKGPGRSPESWMWERLMSVNFNFAPTVKFKCHACGRAMGPTDATCAGCRVRGAPELVNEGIAAVALPIMLGIAIAGTIVVALMMLTG